MAILIALVQQQLLQQPSGGRVSDDRKGICKVSDLLCYTSPIAADSSCTRSTWLP